MQQVASDRQTMKVFIKTFGCQMNFYDSEVAEGFLKDAGYLFTNNEVEADIVLFNTCSVREHAETRVYERLNRMGSKKKTKRGLDRGAFGLHG